MGWNTDEDSIREVLNDEDIKITSHTTVEDRDPELYKKRAKYFYNRDLYEDAEKEYDKAIKYSGGKLKYYFAKISFYFDISDHSSAVQTILKVIWMVAVHRLRSVYWILIAAEAGDISPFLFLLLLFFAVVDLIHVAGKRELNRERHEQEFISIYYIGMAILVFAVVVAILDGVPVIGNILLVVYWGLAGLAVLYSFVLYVRCAVDIHKGQKQRN